MRSCEQSVVRSRRLSIPAGAAQRRSLAHSRRQGRSASDDLGILGELGDGLLAGQVTDLVDGAHHFPIDGIAQDFAHEAAVDLQEIYREVLEYPKEDRPVPKSSRANLQPSSFSDWMKRLACEKLATAAVSVISKQILEASRPLLWN